jgi:hypothetical protein
MRTGKDKEEESSGTNQKAGKNSNPNYGWFGD